MAWRNWKQPLLGGLLVLCLLAAAAQASELKSDEEVILFPTAARLAEGGTRWRLPIHAWVFEPERQSLLTNEILAAAAVALGLDKDVARSAIFGQRTAWFLVDNERGKRIDLTLSPAARALGPSGANGHLYAEVSLERRGSGPEPAPFWLPYAVEPPPGDARLFTGQALFVPEAGLSIISDIDDTVKVSQVRDKNALLANTFLRPFVAVPGMAALYRDLVGKGAVIHYVSSSPWQLYPPLKDFFEVAGLPKGTFHLRAFRLWDQDFFNLFAAGQATKPPVIEAILVDFPGREFILVGDSGEADPEVYGEIARRHPGQIKAVLIRNVTGESAEDARYQDGAFKGLPPDLWHLFQNAGEAAAFLAGRI